MANFRKQFGKIYDQYVDKIYRFVFLKVNSREMAEDLTAEVFSRGWDRFRNGQGKDIENVQAFLYQVARNLVTDHYRERGRARTVSAEEIWAPDSRVDLEKDARLDSDMAQVRFALNKMPEDYAEVVVWRHLDQLSIPEIAKILGKSEGSVRVTLHRALKDLREKLKES